MMARVTWMPQPPGNIIRSGQRCASYELSEVNMRHICPSLPGIGIVPNRDSKQRHLADLNLNFLIKSQRWIREGHAGPRLWLKSFWLFTRHFTSSFFQLSWWDLSCDNYNQATDANSGSAKKMDPNHSSNQSTLEFYNLFDTRKTVPTLGHAKWLGF